MKECHGEKDKRGKRVFVSFGSKIQNFILE